MTVDDIIEWWDGAFICEREEFLRRIRLRKIVPFGYIIDPFRDSTEDISDEMEEQVTELLKKWYTGTENERFLRD